MRILVLYGTTEGQTRKIAGFIAERLMGQGHTPILIDADKQSAGLEPAAFDAILIAARVHAGRYQRSVVRFVQRHLALLQAKPSAFISVSLAVAGHWGLGPNEARTYAEGLFRKTGWTPKHVHHAAGARLYSKLGWFGRWLAGIVDRHRFDPTRDHEFTDWAALGQFIDGWIADAAAIQAAASTAANRPEAITINNP